MQPPDTAGAAEVRGARLLLAYGAGMGLAAAAAWPLSLISVELGAIRNWQTPLTILLLAVLVASPATAESFRTARLPRWLLIGVSVAMLGAYLGCQLGKYFSLGINGVDFSIFDWMLYNTVHRRFMYSPIYDVNHFGIHPSYVMLPLVPLHLIFESPLMLCTLTAGALWLAAVPLWKLAREGLGSEAYAFLTILAYWTCPWISRQLDGGFRPEVFYPLFGLLLVLGWVRRSPGLWIPSLAAFLSIKEDAAFMVISLGVGSLLLEPARRRAASALVASGLLVLGVNLGVVQPLALRGHARAQPEYLHFWSQYGSTMGEIARAMIRSPFRVARDTLTSSWYRLFGSALFLPLLSPLPLFPMLPTILLLGSSSYSAMRDYAIYYPIPLIPFFFWGLVDAYPRWVRLRRWLLRPELLYAAVLLVFPLVGGGYLRIQRWNSEALRALPGVRERLATIPGPICVQSVLFPQLPYRLDLHPLFEDLCVAIPEAPIVVNPKLDPYPLGHRWIREMIRQAEDRGEAEVLDDGFTILHRRKR
jgi:uncharacterized membrane protein